MAQICGKLTSKGIVCKRVGKCPYHHSRPTLKHVVNDDRQVKQALLRSYKKVKRHA